MIDFGYRFPDKPIETTPNVVAKLSPKLWLGQAKKDGWRLETYIDGPGHVRCLTRMGRPMNEVLRSKFPKEIPDLFEQMELPAGTVIDAEFVGPRGQLPFAVYIFDMLAWDGEWLVNEPYERRWERCLNLNIPAGLIDTVETVQDNFLEFFNRLKAEWDGKSITLNEGIVLKSRKGKLKLDRNRSQKSDVQFKLKYRDIGEKRW